LKAAAVRHGQRVAESAAPQQYRALKRTLERARDAGTPICFIAFPMRVAAGELPYPIDPELERLVRAGGADFIDLRVMPELAFEDYRDPVHLIATGGVKYSRRLSEILVSKLRSVSGFGLHACCK
jgi:hypothetical protein